MRASAAPETTSRLCYGPTPHADRKGALPGNYGLGSCSRNHQIPKSVRATHERATSTTPKQTRAVPATRCQPTGSPNTTTPRSIVRINPRPTSGYATDKSSRAKTASHNKAPIPYKKNPVLTHGVRTLCTVRVIASIGPDVVAVEALVCAMPSLKQSCAQADSATLSRAKKYVRLIGHLRHATRAASDLRSRRLFGGILVAFRRLGNRRSAPKLQAQ